MSRMIRTFWAVLGQAIIILILVASVIFHIGYLLELWP
jgi:hypothetical protein